MTPKYQLQINTGNGWQSCGKSSYRYNPVREAFLDLALSMQTAGVPVGYSLRVVDNGKSHKPVYDEWEHIA